MVAVSSSSCCCSSSSGGAGDGGGSCSNISSSSSSTCSSGSYERYSSPALECLELSSGFLIPVHLFLSLSLSLPLFLSYRLVGLVVKASALRAEDPGFESRLCRDFLGSSHTSDLKIGTPVATLPGAWCYRVSPPAFLYQNFLYFQNMTERADESVIEMEDGIVDGRTGERGSHRRRATPSTCTARGWRKTCCARPSPTLAKSSTSTSSGRGS